MTNEGPPIPANDDFSPEEQAEIEAFKSSMGRVFAINQDIAQMTQAVEGSLATLEAYVNGPAVGRASAATRFNALASYYERLAKRRLDSPDTFIIDPGFNALGARLETLRAKIEQLP